MEAVPPTADLLTAEALMEVVPMAMAAALMVMIRLPVSGKPLVDLADISSKVITPASLLHMTQFGIISAITVMKKLSMY